MKKLHLCLLMALVVSIQAFAQESREFSFESWTSLGVSYENIFTKGQDMHDMKADSIGLDATTFTFINRSPVGFFSHIYAPLTTLSNNLPNGNNLNQLLGVAIGPGFMVELGNNLALQFGLGFELKCFWIESDKPKHVDNNLTFGVGADIGLKYNFTNTWYVGIGSKVSYAFANYRQATSRTDDPDLFRQDFDGWVKNYSLIGFAPYLSIGYVISGKTSRQLGRSPR